jgi:hypothetical protein
METYFKIRTVLEYIVPLFILIAIVIYFSYGAIKTNLKFKLMNKLGYEYKRGLGTNVAHEFQPHWVKGHTKIHYRKIDNLKYREIRKYVESKEETK